MDTSTIRMTSDKKSNSYSKRVSTGGGSVMVWEAFGFKGKTKQADLNGQINAVKYQDILQSTVGKDLREKLAISARQCFH